MDVYIYIYIYESLYGLSFRPLIQTQSAQGLAAPPRTDAGDHMYVLLYECIYACMHACRQACTYFCALRTCDAHASRRAPESRCPLAGSPSLDLHDAEASFRTACIIRNKPRFRAARGVHDPAADIAPVLECIVHLPGSEAFWALLLTGELQPALLP